MNPKETVDSLPILSAMGFPGMVHASTIRSTVARAKNFSMLREQLPPGYIRITAADLAGENVDPAFSEGFPLFAGPSISYRGQTLGLIIGPDPGLCDELAKAVKVEYDEEEPELEWESFSSSQIAYRYAVDYGDVDYAFSKSTRKERSVYRNGIFDHHYSEPMGALINWEYDKMVIYCASQWPDQVRKAVAAAAKVSIGDIIVRPTHVGRSFDGRLWFPSYVACQAAIAAKICRKPVKILYTREEDFLYTLKQTRSVVTIKSSSDDEGRLQALDIKIIINIGVFNPNVQEIIHQAAAAVTGIYACPAIRIEAYAIRSNILPLGAMGSIGATHAFYSIEAHLNHLAKLAGKTPAEIKTLNMLSKGMSNFGARPLDSEIPFARIHRKLETTSDYRRKYASYELVKKRDSGSSGGIIRGIALTVGYQTGRSFSDKPSMNAYNVETVLDRNLDLVITTQSSIASENLRAMWRTTAASALSIPESAVRFAPPNSDTTLPCGPLTLSRGASTVNKLIERTCRAIQKKRFRESLPLVAKAQTRVSRDSASSSGDSLGGLLFDAASWCGTAVEIEIDRLSGEPRPIAVWMVIDAGRIVKKELALSSLRSSIISALNLCIGRDFDPDGVKEQYLAYGRLRFNDLPFIGIEFVDSERTTVSKGLGELPFLTIPAAFHSALTQALGVEPRQLPLAGNEILRLLESPL